MSVLCRLNVHRWKSEQMVAWTFGESVRKRCKHCDEELIIHSLFRQKSQWSGV